MKLLSGSIEIRFVSRLYMATGQYSRRLHLLCENDMHVVDLLLTREQAEELITRLKHELRKEL